MATPIESFLFAELGVHAVIEFTQSEHSIRLRVAPWESVESWREAIFGQAKITSIDVYADDPEGLNMPWDIIGFDCNNLDGERWGFVLHCDGIEYGFESEWPKLSIP
jgi:hypothetical protein